jgi:hypothetical protein
MNKDEQLYSTTRHEHYKNEREAEAVENERETDTERVECERALYGLSMTSPTLPLNFCLFSSARPHLSREGSSSRYSEASS